MDTIHSIEKKNCIAIIIVIYWYIYFWSAKLLSLDRKIIVFWSATLSLLASNFIGFVSKIFFFKYWSLMWIIRNLAFKYSDFLISRPFRCRPILIFTLQKFQIWLLFVLQELSIRLIILLQVLKLLTVSPFAESYQLIKLIILLFKK